jgi:hypothetical protein
MADLLTLFVCVFGWAAIGASVVYIILILLTALGADWAADLLEAITKRLL